VPLVVHDDRVVTRVMSILRGMIFATVVDVMRLGANLSEPLLGQGLEIRKIWQKI
jgi:hypothetical protein